MHYSFALAPSAIAIFSERVSVGMEKWLDSTLIVQLKN
jgi:hypothetical protein